MKMENEVVNLEELAPSRRYAVELKDDLELTMMNLREKALTCSGLKAKWIGYLAKERDAMKKLLSVRSDYSQKLNASVKMNGANAFEKLKTANTSDDTLKKIDSTKKDIENALEIINHAIQSFSEFNYNIKNVIDIMKMNNG